MQCANTHDLQTRYDGSRLIVPHIWIGDTDVGGWDELYALDQAGQLDPLLAAA